MKNLRNILAYVFILLAAPLVLAHMNASHDEFGLHSNIIKQLNLTAAQKARYEEIRTSSLDQFNSLIDKKDEAKSRLKETLATGTDEEIRAAHQQIADIKDEMMKQKFENFLAFRKVLTTDQKKKLAALKEKYREQYEE